MSASEKHKCVCGCTDSLRVMNLWKHTIFFNAVFGSKFIVCGSHGTCNSKKKTKMLNTGIPDQRCVWKNYKEKSIQIMTPALSSMLQDVILIYCKNEKKAECTNTHWVFKNVWKTWKNKLKCFQNDDIDLVQLRWRPGWFLLTSLRGHKISYAEDLHSAQNINHSISNVLCETETIKKMSLAEQKRNMSITLSYFCFWSQEICHQPIMKSWLFLKKCNGRTFLQNLDSGQRSGMEIFFASGKLLTSPYGKKMHDWILSTFKLKTLGK